MYVSGKKMTFQSTHGIPYQTHTVRRRDRNRVWKNARNGKSHIEETRQKEAVIKASSVGICKEQKESENSRR
jgi:hypothetical protein